MSNASGPSRQATSDKPAKPPVVQPGTGNNIIINPCQRGNPILENVKNVGKEFGDIVADYQVGRTTGVLFLSLRYHRLHPEYIYQRIERLGNSYNLRVLLLMCDVSEHQEPIRELTKTCVINNITVMVAWTAEEAGFYLSTYKQFEHKPPDLIKERVDQSYEAILRTALTTISKVNKTDVETLRTSFGSFVGIARASSEQLQNLPGVGQVKAKRIQDAFEKPFRNNATSSLSQARLNSVLTQAVASADKGKGKEREHPPPTVPAAPETRAARPRPPREPSPVWDIELDLNDDTPSPPRPSPPPPAHATAPSRKRPPSPAWDIELDLNESDGEIAGTGNKKTSRMQDEFGQPLFLQDTP